MELTDQTYTTVDPTENPDEAMALTSDAIGRKEKDPPPRIQDPPDTSVRLPGGLLWDGEFITRAEVRELTGGDEEALAKATRKSTGARATMVRTLLHRAVVSVGKHEPPPPGLLDALLVGDRETLLLAIRRATYGDDLELTLTCPTCGATMDAVYDLDEDIPIKYLPNTEEPRVFEVELKRGRKARVVLPCGSDQEEAFSDGDRSIPETNTYFLAACVLDIDGEPLNGLEGARSLGIQDRRKILNIMAENQPGPKYEEVTQACLKCGEEFQLGIDLLTLFRGSD